MALWMTRATKDDSAPVSFAEAHLLFGGLCASMPHSKQLILNKLRTIQKADFE